MKKTTLDGITRWRCNEQGNCLTYGFRGCKECNAMSAPAEWIAVVKGQKPDLPEGSRIAVRHLDGWESKNDYLVDDIHDWTSARNPASNVIVAYLVTSLAAAQPKRDSTACWRCREPYPMAELACPACGASNANHCCLQAQRESAAIHADEGQPASGVRESRATVAGLGAGKAETPAPSQSDSHPYLRPNLDLWLALRGRKPWPETVRPVMEGFPLNAMRRFL